MRPPDRLLEPFARRVSRLAISCTRCWWTRGRRQRDLNSSGRYVYTIVECHWRVYLSARGYNIRRAIRLTCTFPSILQCNNQCSHCSAEVACAQGRKWQSGIDVILTSPKAYKEGFVKAMNQWIRGSQFKSVVILTGVDTTNRSDAQMQ